MMTDEGFRLDAYDESIQPRPRKTEMIITADGRRKPVGDSDLARWRRRVARGTD